MTVPAVHCEAKKVAYRQTKDGLVVSFVIHPNDMPDALAVAPLGQRYMLAMAAIGDDEKPVDGIPADVLEHEHRKKEGLPSAASQRGKERYAARIPRSLPVYNRKPNPRRAVTHLAFVREIGICLACGAVGPCQAMHIRNRTDGGMGLKPSDRFSAPGCFACHDRQHKIGEETFWGELGIDPLDVACRLWTISGDIEAGKSVIFKARQRIALHQRAFEGSRSSQSPEIAPRGYSPGKT
jgi:hypothetical protein